MSEEFPDLEDSVPPRMRVNYTQRKEVCERARDGVSDDTPDRVILVVYETNIPHKRPGIENSFRPWCLSSTIRILNSPEINLYSTGEPL